MAAGKPVVATAVGGSAELIEHGRTGLLVEPDDPPAMASAIESLLADHSLAQRLAEKAMQSIDRFQFDNVARQHERLYHQLLGWSSGME